ncbi:hypothetical protein D3C75_547700 [compost metagenome]
MPSAVLPSIRLPPLNTAPSLTTRREALELPFSCPLDRMVRLSLAVTLPWTEPAIMMFLAFMLDFTIPFSPMTTSPALSTSPWMVPSIRTPAWERIFPSNTLPSPMTVSMASGLVPAVFFLLNMAILPFARPSGRYWGQHFYYPSAPRSGDGGRCFFRWSPQVRSPDLS